MNEAHPDLAARLMTWSLRFVAEERAEWAHAMAAELPHAEGRVARLQWSVSCSLLLLRQWLRRRFTNSTETKFEGRAMKRPVIAAVVTCVVLVAGLCFLPEFREGLTVAKAFLGNAFTSRVGYSKAELARLEERAEREHNAKLMAYVALHSNEGMQGETEFSADARRRARRAVQMDAEYTWIYARLCTDSRTYAIAECGEMIRDLEAWDPVNSVPYLLEASRVRWEDDPASRHVYEPTNDPRWYAAMAHAFAAGHYEAYGKRHANLERSVYNDLHQGTILEVMKGLEWSDGLVSFGGAHVYAREELQRNPQNVIDFGRRVVAGGESGQIAGLYLVVEGEKRLNALKPGAVPNLQIADDEQLLDTIIEHGKEYLPSWLSLRYTFQAVVLMSVISAGVWLVLIGICAGQWIRRQAPGVRLQMAAAIASGALGSAAVGLWLAYRPFFGYAQVALRHPNPGGFFGAGAVWFLNVPIWWNWTWQSLWTWEFVLGLCVIALVIVVGRAMRRGNHRVRPA